MCTEGDYYDPTGSLPFILPSLLARMLKFSSSQDGGFVFYPVVCTSPAAVTDSPMIGVFTLTTNLNGI